MAAIQNARDLLLQAADPRVVPVLIPIDQIDGLGPAIMGLRITATDNTFYGLTGSTTPATITLTVEKLGGLTGVPAWQVISGSATLAQSGDTCVVTGSTVAGKSVTIRARVGYAGQNYDAQIVLNKLGSLSGQEAVNLATQITGQLANGNVSGLKALALLDSVSLSNPLQVFGDLAAQRIGAGQLAAGVIYAGTVNVDNLVGTTIYGKSISGGDLIYIGGINAAAPIALTRISADEGRATVRGFLSVSRTDSQSSFEIASNNNLSHGNISLGVTARFLGSSFSVFNQSVSYPNVQSSGTSVSLRHDNIRLLNAAGTLLLEAISARVQIRTALNILPGGSFSGGASGDIVNNGSALGVNIGGVWRRIVTEAI